jgi:hypothetical protein
MSGLSPRNRSSVATLTGVRRSVVVRIPYYLSPGWLRIDPTFAPLKGNPRFQ